jgi:hypothetical protein
MRHSDSKVTLDHYAHVIGDAERVASEKLFRKIGHNLAKLESQPQLELKPNLLETRSLAEACESRTHHSAR